MGSSAVPQPFRWQSITVSSKAGPTPLHVISTAASVGLCQFLRHHLRLGFHLRCSFEKLLHLCEVSRLKVFWCQRAFQFDGSNSVHPTENPFLPPFSSSLCFFDGGETKPNTRKEEGSNPEGSKRNSFNRRLWTNLLLGINVSIYIAQVATQGQLMLWGAKINGLIDKGQLWRLVTSSMLHANVAHLMVNCYSLNSVGPTVERFCGPRRFLAIYWTSAIASSAMSYWFNKAPSVGASGAIFGLVGSLAVFVMRHKEMLGGSNEDLLQIAQVISLNMAMGLLLKGIDNWGHIGGLLGGTATSWLLGPAMKYESSTTSGRRVLTDQAPIFFLINRRREA